MDALSLTTAPTLRLCSQCGTRETDDQLRITRGTTCGTCGRCYGCGGLVGCTCGVTVHFFAQRAATAGAVEGRRHDPSSKAAGPQGTRPRDSREAGTNGESPAAVPAVAWSPAFDELPELPPTHDLGGEGG